MRTIALRLLTTLLGLFQSRSLLYLEILANNWPWLTKHHANDSTLIGVSGYSGSGSSVCDQGACKHFGFSNQIPLCGGTARAFDSTGRGIPSLQGRAPTYSTGAARTFPDDIKGKRWLGCAADSRRTSDARHRGLSGDSRKIHDPSASPSQTWRSSLNNRVKALVSVDFFTVPTVGF
jgi:hypothetical protein